jgi:hypothetical protein
MLVLFYIYIYIYIYIPLIMIINRIYETQKLLSLQIISFLVGLRTYQHSCNSASAINTREDEAEYEKKNVFLEYTNSGSWYAAWLLF